MEYLLLVFITSSLITLFTVPPLIKVAVMKRLFDMPDDFRKVHTRSIPTIGGIIIFAATLFSYALWYPIVEVREFKYIVAGLLVMFFVGVKDDIIGTAPVKKLVAFIIVSMMIVLMANVKLTSLHGLFGVNEIPDWAQVFLSVFTIIVIVNAFNLIDGIDGLASGIGLIASLSYGFWFFFAGELSMSCLAFSLAGSLASFLIFNFSPAKIFMGDSGSLTIGLIVSILTIKLIEYDTAAIPNNFLTTLSRPVFALAVLVFPLYDTLRIFIYRALKGVSPFSADKKHIHHRLLKIGYTHRGAALILYISSAFIISVVLASFKLETTFQFLIMGSVTLMVAQIPFLIDPPAKKEE